MELLVFAIVAARNGYQQEETSASAPAQFRPFDLRALTVESKWRSIVRSNRGLAAGVAAQRTLQNVFAGLQLAIAQPIALGDVIEVENVVGTIEEITFSFVSVRLRDLRRLILPVTYFLEKPFTNWTRTSAESLTSFSLVLSLAASLPAIRQQVDTILRAHPLWNGGKWEVMVSELGETSMVVRITLGAANPEVAFQLKSQVQEDILKYLNQFKEGSLMGAFANPKPAMELAETTKPPTSEPTNPKC
jgi:Mechanosensitive ion channel